MRSCSESQAQGTCVWWNARNARSRPSGKASATRESRSTSAIIRSITKPRNASTALLRCARVWTPVSLVSGFRCVSNEIICRPWAAAARQVLRGPQALQ